ncbi:MAG: hypothetical protein QNJ72_39465 [Pleurocapsa sp. MO_226.B13]|nr:hypothetical protein [Pleurocapsa sp. MO_226.B13]
MPRTNNRSTSTKTKAQAKCTLTIKPRVLSNNLKLLNAAISSNQKGLDRVQIEVGEGQSIFSVAGDTIGVKVHHKATKSKQFPSIQVSCRQFMNLANRLDNTSQNLELCKEQVTISNKKNTYQHKLVTYKEVLPQNKSQFTPTVVVEAAKFKQALERVVPFLNSEAKEITSGVCLQIKRSEPTEFDNGSIQLTMTGLSEPGMGTTTITVEPVESDDSGNTGDIVLILPKKAIAFIASQAANFIISIAEGAVRFTWDNIECTLQTLKGEEYPDLDRVKASIDKNDISVEFNRQELLNALKRHQVMSSEITFKIESDNCQLVQATELGSGAENLFCSCDRAELITLHLHIDYLIKAISAIEGETAEFKLNLEPDEDGDIANTVAIQDENSLYCLMQLVSED